MYKIGSSSFPLKTYSLHLVLGFLASGGSLYLTTTPFTMLVSSINRPETCMLTLSLPAVAAAVPFPALVGPVADPSAAEAGGAVVL